MGEYDAITALVTGGASGIGAAIVARLVASGARVAVLDQSLPEPTDSAVIRVQADVTSDAAVVDAVASAVEQLGGLDVLV
ncbi:MAG: SDR family NAD(P)-dependent oxidoreductase, partial [Mycobacteriaceae bacterium]